MLHIVGMEHEEANFKETKFMISSLLSMTKKPTIIIEAEAEIGEIEPNKKRHGFMSRIQKIFKNHVKTIREKNQQ